MEEWITLLLRRRDVLVCSACSKAMREQLVHMYVNVDNEIEEVLCEECWTKVDTPTIKKYLDIGSPYKGLSGIVKILGIQEK